MKRNYFFSAMMAAMLLAMPATADVVNLHTAAPVGEKISIALNENVHATITWGNGASEQVSFNGTEFELVVKDAAFDVRSEEPITNLFCPDCSLDNLDLSMAPNLVSLTCADNKLSSLSLSKNVKLVELNCGGNQLSELNLSKCPNLEIVDISDNIFSFFNFPVLSRLKTLICSDNKLSTLSLRNLDALQTVWCQGNVLEAIYFSSNVTPAQICAFDNKLENISASLLKNARELWLDNNKMKTLDISSSRLNLLSVSNNLLNLIKLNPASEDSLKCMYADGNQLMVNSLPKISHDMFVNYDNMVPYYLTDTLNINEKIKIDNYTSVNVWGASFRPSINWYGDGAKLSSGVDYTYADGEVSFLKPFKKVSSEIIIKRHYPNVIFKFQDFTVVDPTGVEDVLADNGFTVVAEGGHIKVTNTQATNVRICNIGGAVLVDEYVSAGAHQWTLPAGVYIVNGQKVLLNR